MVSEMTPGWEKGDPIPLISAFIGILLMVIGLAPLNCIILTISLPFLSFTVGCVFEKIRLEESK
jgi:hypothetical protein